MTPPRFDAAYEEFADRLEAAERTWPWDGDYPPDFTPRPQVVALDLEIAHTISESLRDMWHRGGLEKEAERAWGVLDAQIAAVEGK